MPFGLGFGRGFGRGFGHGFSMGAIGPYGYGGYTYPSWGWGRCRGNPFPYCRNFPWLPRWWWASSQANQYSATIPYYGYGNPYYNYNMMFPYANPGFTGYNTPQATQAPQPTQ